MNELDKHIYKQEINVNLSKIFKLDRFTVSNKLELKYHPSNNLWVHERYVISNLVDENTSVNILTKIAKEQIEIFFKKVKQLSFFKALEHIAYDVRVVEKMDTFSIRLMFSFLLVEKAGLMIISNKMKKRRRFMKRKGIK